VSGTDRFGNWVLRLDAGELLLAINDLIKCAFRALAKQR
jgi:hypothetical protein